MDLLLRKYWSPAASVPLPDRPWDALSGAHLAWELAPRHCTEVSHPFWQCEAYHRIRPFLRALGLASEPADHARFLEPALAEAFRAGCLETLIAGAADEAMAELVAEAARSAGIAPQITVVDRCPTPLAVNAGFARARGIALRTVQADLLAYAGEHYFDILTTHSVLGYFTPEERPRLVEQWRRLLRPGGRVITVARIRPAAGGSAAPRGAAENLCEEVRRRAAESDGKLRVAPEELARAAMDFARLKASIPLASLDELERMLAAAGFRLLHAALAPGVRKPCEMSPAAEPAALFAEIVAQRR